MSTSGMAARESQSQSMSQHDTRGTEKINNPHVVRVTFLGVAGILCSNETFVVDESFNTYNDSSGGISSGNTNFGSTNLIANFNRTSVNFVPPSQMRLAASISRTPKARGIACGLSGRLRGSTFGAAANVADNSSNRGGDAGAATCAASNASAGAAGASVGAGGNNASSYAGGRYNEVRNNAAMNAGSSTAGTTADTNRQPEIIRTKSRDLLPPSRLMHRNASNRTSATSSVVGEASRQLLPSFVGDTLRQNSTNETNFQTATTAHQTNSQAVSIKSDSFLDEMKDSVEVRAEEVLSAFHQSSNSANNKTKNVDRADFVKGSSMNDCNDNLTLPQRYVAVWENVKSSNNDTANYGADNDANKNANPKSSKRRNNTLAFEAELIPTQDTDEKNEDLDEKRIVYAPKTFCITVGLVPDVVEAPTNESQNGNATLSKKEDEQSNDHEDQSSNNSTKYAIPLAFANLVITGNETLDGQTLQVDLPLNSCGNFGEWPLLELGGAVGTGNQTMENDNNEKSIAAKTKKKKSIKRFFSRKANNAKPHEAANATDDAHDNGTPSSSTSKMFFSRKSINAKPLNEVKPNIDTPTNTLYAPQHQLFQHYNIDEGDAVLRIGLEVFQRGSELESMIKRRNRRRRAEEKKRRLLENSAAGDKQMIFENEKSLGVEEAAESSTQQVQPNEPLNRTTSTGTHSLIDTTDVQSDYSYEEEVTSSYFSLESETTWEESTFFTYNEDESFYSMDTMSYTTAELRDAMKNGEGNSVFDRMFDCKMSDVDENTTITAAEAISFDPEFRAASASGGRSKQNFSLGLRSIFNLNCGNTGKPVHTQVSRDVVPILSDSVLPGLNEEKGVDNNNHPRRNHQESNENHSVSLEQGKEIDVSSPLLQETFTEPIERTATTVTGIGTTATGTATNVTVGNEESPMAIIVQRAPVGIILSEKVEPQDKDSDDEFNELMEGLEMTLEDVSTSF